MGRKKWNPIDKFYDHDKESDKTKCKSCGKELEGYVVSNMRKHLKKKGHEALLQEYLALEAKTKPSNQGNVA